MNAIDPLGTKRDDLAGFLGDIERIEAIFVAWDETRQGAVAAYRRAVEDLQGEAIRRLLRVLKAEPAAMAALKEAVTDEVVYAVLRRHGILKPSVTERVEAALDSVRPMLASHGGDVALVSVAPPAVELRFTGSCDGCPASALTFHAGVKKAIEEHCPEITQIHQVKGLDDARENGVRFISPFASAGAGGWQWACRLDEIPEGGIHTTIIGGEKLLLSRQGATVSCFQNACAHLGLALDGGTVTDGIIACPYHDFRYDLATGECLTAPEVQLHSHAVRVIGDRVEVRLAS